MRYIMKKSSILFALVVVLACVSLTTGCASSGKLSKPAPVPEVEPGYLVGYLPPKALPNSLALLPPPPTAGSAAQACDEEVSRKALALRGRSRWALANEDANIMFPQAAGTFSCALNAPITEQDTPYLYVLLRRTLSNVAVSTFPAKNHYQRTRPFMVNKEPICPTD